MEAIFPDMEVYRSRAGDYRRFRPPFDSRSQLGTLAIIAVTSLLALIAKPDFGVAGSALIFVLGIVLAGAFFGVVAALVTAGIAFLLFNFFLATPVLTFSLTRGRDLLPLIIFNLCALTAGLLAGRLKDREQRVSRSNRQLAGLLEASQAMQSAIRLSDIARHLSQVDWNRLDVTPRLFHLENDRLAPLDTIEVAEAWRSLAEASCHAQTPVRSGDLIAYRLDGGSGVLGAMVVQKPARERHDTAFLSALASIFALAIERATLSERISESRATARTEELKAAVLSSISHDFRTPLTTISASASSLVDYGDKLGRETRARLLRGIVDECERLNRFTANLLEMSRIAAGGSAARLQRLSASEIVAAVVQRMRPRAGNRRIELAANDGDLPINANAALFDLALVNVIENAIRYSDDGMRIRASIEKDTDYCCITVADEGCGIADAELDRVFERFYRGAHADASTRGSGLGLAIAKGFVEALGGSIEARSPGIGDKGVKIVIRLPLAEETA